MPDFDAFQVFTLGAVLGLVLGSRLGWHLALLLLRPPPRPWRPLVRAWRWMEWWRLPEDVRWLMRAWGLA